MTVRSTHQEMKTFLALVVLAMTCSRSLAACGGTTITNPKLFWIDGGSAADPTAQIDHTTLPYQTDSGFTVNAGVGCCSARSATDSVSRCGGN